MKKICFIAQFPPPMHGLSKAVETLYNSNLNFEIDSQGEFEFEKVDITNNKNFIKNLLKISRSKADLFYFTISQTKGGNLRDLVIFKLLELQHKKCLIHLHGGYYRQLVDNDMAGWQRKANYKAIKKLSGAIVLSKSLKKIFEGMIDEDKIFVVENCVDDQYLLTDQEIDEKLKALENEKVLHVLWLSKINVQQSLMERIDGVKSTGLADEIIVEEYEGQKIDDIKKYDVDIFTVGSDWKGKFDYLNEYCKVVYLERTQGVSSTEIREQKRQLRMGLIGESKYLCKLLKESTYVKYLVDSLDKNGYRHKGEAGNFIFIEPKTDAQTVVDRMKAEKKILIKAYPNVGEFGNCLRVSIGEEKYMKQFMDALLEIDQ